MSKLTVLLVFLSFHFQHLAVAQTINQTDDNDKRHGQWQKTYEGSKQLRYSGTFDHGQEIGTFKFYDVKGGHPTAIKQYTSGSTLIDVKFFTTEEKKVSEGKMEGRTRTGEWKSYHQDGTSLMIKEVYKEGKLQGDRTVYFISGGIAQTETYEEGKREGKAMYYSEDGKVLKNLIYKNDKLEGVAKLYNGFGELEVEGNYKNNRKHGIWKYYKNGKVNKEIKYPRNKIGVQ